MFVYMIHFRKTHIFFDTMFKCSCPTSNAYTSEIFEKRRKIYCNCNININCLRKFQAFLSHKYEQKCLFSIRINWKFYPKKPLVTITRLQTRAYEFYFGNFIQVRSFNAFRIFNHLFTIKCFQLGQKNAFANLSTLVAETYSGVEKM